MLARCLVSAGRIRFMVDVDERFRPLMVNRRVRFGWMKSCMLEGRNSLPCFPL